MAVSGVICIQKFVKIGKLIKVETGTQRNIYTYHDNLIILLFP
jgi:hypothetical protein